MLDDALNSIKLELLGAGCALVLAEAGQVNLAMKPENGNKYKLETKCSTQAHMLCDTAQMKNIHHKSGVEVLVWQAHVLSDELSVRTAWRHSHVEVSDAAMRLS